MPALPPRITPTFGANPPKAVNNPVAPRSPALQPRPGAPKLPIYHKGGIVKKTGPAIVKKGEKIIPASKVKSKKK